MIDTDKYTGHTPAPWGIDLGEEDGDIINSDSVVYRGQVMDWLIAENIERENLYLIADAPLLLAEVKRLRHLCDTLFIYAHNIETGQSTIEKSNGEPLSTIDFEKDMTWLVTECKAGHLVGETGYEDCPDCGGDDE